MQNKYFDITIAAITTAMRKQCTFVSLYLLSLFTVLYCQVYTALGRKVSVLLFSDIVSAPVLTALNMFKMQKNSQTCCICSCCFLLR